MCIMYTMYMNKKTYTLQYIVWREDNQYVSQCLNTGIASCGTTKKEAIQNLTEALNLYFEDNTQEPVSIIKPEIMTVTYQNA